MHYKYKTYFYLAILACCAPCKAQTYNFSGGIRLGTEIGITLKYRLTDKITLEGVVQSPINEEEVITTLLIEKHNSVLSKGLNIYYGGGIQKGWLGSEVNENDEAFGVVGIIGAELNIARVNLSYDFKPAVNITGGSSKVRIQTGISIRYIFDKRNIFLPDSKKKTKKKKKRLKERAKRKRFKQKLKDKYSRKKNSLG